MYRFNTQHNEKKKIRYNNELKSSIINDYKRFERR